MTRLDKNRPYGTVFGGQTGGTYHQDGKLFHSDGREVGAAPEPVADVADVAPPVAAPETGAVVVPDAAPEPAADAAATREDLQGLHPSKIKKLMEMNGLTPVTGPGSKAKNIDLLLSQDAG